MPLSSTEAAWSAVSISADEESWWRKLVVWSGHGEHMEQDVDWDAVLGADQKRGVDFDAERRAASLAPALVERGTRI